MYSSRKHSYRLNQPFLKEEVCGYRELVKEQPLKALFYEFSIPPMQTPGGPGYCDLSYIPNGGVDLIFMIKGERRLMEFVGICTRMRSLIGFRGARYFGVRLYPGTRISSRGLCLSDTIDSERFFRGDDELLQPFFESLDHARTLEERADLFYRHFADEMGKEETDELTCRLLEEISRSHGNIRIQELADRTHYSERHISRIFRESVGISPKAYARIVRFQYVVHAIMYHPQSAICDYLEELGYSDQAHFQREFKQYAGITPGSFARQVRG